jgi:hypothetical protein
LGDRDLQVHKAISWAARKDYEIHVGISLGIPDPAGDGTHEIGHWKFTKNLLMIASANELCDWLVETFIQRDMTTHQLPTGIQRTGEEMEVHIQKNGDGAYIWFIHRESLATDMENMPNIVKIEYADVYETLGMPDQYTMRMSFMGFHTLTEGWLLLPIICSRRDATYL